MDADGVACIHAQDSVSMRVICLVSINVLLFVGMRANKGVRRYVIPVAKEDAIKDAILLAGHHVITLALTLPL